MSIQNSFVQKTFYNIQFANFMISMNKRRSFYCLGLKFIVSRLFLIRNLNVLHHLL